MRYVGSSKAPRRRTRSRRHPAAGGRNHDVPDHLPFGHHHDETDEPHNSLQDAFEHFFAGLGDFLGHLRAQDDDRD